MEINVLTLFPDMITSYASQSIIKKARETGHLNLNVYDFREYSPFKHKSVDDYPYGGGQGMLLRVEPIVNCLNHIHKKGKIVLLSPRGRVLKQNVLQELSCHECLTLVCGHYEGFDERIYDYCDEVISLGDYVLTGGEIGALAIIDGVTRLIDGVLKKEASLDESFSKHLLEYAQYTKPRIFDGKAVPEVLFSGHHQNILKFRENSAREITLKYRPDLLKKFE